VHYKCQYVMHFEVDVVVVVDVVVDVDVDPDACIKNK
jgi:hypothetical protein